MPHYNACLPNVSFPDMHQRIYPSRRHILWHCKGHTAGIGNLVSPCGNNSCLTVWTWTNRNYTCKLVNLFNREIISYSSGSHNTAGLVKQAFMTVNGGLKSIHIFHTDRGNELKNRIIEKMLETFDITRWLSHKGCSYDNTAAKATFKIIKTEFVKTRDLKILMHWNYNFLIMWIGLIIIEFIPRLVIKHQSNSG